MKRELLVAILLFSASGFAAAERPTGSELLTQCKKAIRYVEGEHGLSAQDIIDASSCLSYLQGVRDALTTQYVGHGDTAVMCLSPQVTDSQLARIFIKWAEAAPERLHEDAFRGVIAAFFPQFACPSRPAPPIA